MYMNMTLIQLVVRDHRDRHTIVENCIILLSLDMYECYVLINVNVDTLYLLIQSQISIDIKQTRLKVHINQFDGKIV